MYIQHTDIEATEAELYEMLGIDEGDGSSLGYGYHIFSPNPEVETSSEYEKALTDAFRGVVPVNRPRSQGAVTITQAKATSLALVGIETKVGSTFVKGLIHTTVKQDDHTKPIDLVGLKLYMESLLFGPERDLFKQLTLPLYQDYNRITARLQNRYLVGSTREVTGLVDERDTILSRFATMVLPKGTLASLVDPAYFIEETSVLLGKAVMVALHRYQTLEEQIPVSDYPSVQETRRANEAAYEQARADLTKALHRKLAVRLPGISPTSREKLLAEIQQLRPSMASLRTRYAEQGYPGDVIAKLVSVENYDQLPGVKLNKRQHKFLLGLFDGLTDQELISNGYV